MKAVLLVGVLGACYRVHGEDCVIRCGNGCPEGLVCGSDGLCSGAGGGVGGGGHGCGNDGTGHLVMTAGQDASGAGNGAGGGGGGGGCGYIAIRGTSAFAGTAMPAVQ